MQNPPVSPAAIRPSVPSRSLLLAPALRLSAPAATPSSHASCREAYAVPANEYTKLVVR